MKIPSLVLKIVSVVAFLIGLSGIMWAQGPCGAKPCKVEKTSEPATAVSPRRNPKPIRPPLEKVNTPAVGSLLVNSNSANATVTINNRAIGTTDGNGYFDPGPLKPGSYTVSITKPGYHPGRQVVNLAAGRTETLQFALAPITQVLNISSNPPDCEIFIDDIPRGRTDDSGKARFADIPIGDHNVSLRKPRYREALFPVSLVQAEEGQINAALQFAVGFLTVKTNVSDASIEISGLGNFRGSVDSLDCQPGSYSVTVSSPLYESLTREISVTAGEASNVEIKLNADESARNQVLSKIQDAYTRGNYDVAIATAMQFVSVDSKQPRALSILAQSLFMKNDFGSFAELAGRAVEAGGDIELILRHHHSSWGLAGSSSMHPIKLIIKDKTISIDPQLKQGVLCSLSGVSTDTLQGLRTIELDGNQKNEVYLHLVFTDLANPKKTAGFKFADRESRLVRETKTKSAGGIIGLKYEGETMVSRPQALPALTAIVGFLNHTKTEAQTRLTARSEVLPLIAGEPAPASAMPTVESIIDKAIKAVGGRGKFASSIQKGTYTWTDVSNGLTLSGTFEEQVQTPDKFYHTFNQEKIGVFFEEGFDGAIGWYKSYKNKPQVMTASSQASIRRALVMSSLTDPKEFNEIYPSSRIKASGRLAERDVHIVEATLPEGKLEAFYFDTQTGLLIRKDTTYQDPKKKGATISTTVLFEDYVEMDGRKIATHLKQISPHFVISIKTSAVNYDVPVNAAKFKMPSK